MAHRSEASSSRPRTRCSGGLRPLVTLSDLESASPAQRARIRRTLTPLLDELVRDVTRARETLDGPDPEQAAVDLLEGILAFRAGMKKRCARLMKRAPAAQLRLIHGALAAATLLPLLSS